MSFIKMNKKEVNSDRIFLDRHDILESIEINARIYNEQNNFFKLFAFYGMGGIGKSKLIQKIESTYRGSPIMPYPYPLEILNQETIPSILLCIRKKFNKTPHFDYALFRYWDYISCDRVDRESLYSISQKIFNRLGKIVDAAVWQGYLDTECVVRDLIILYEEKVIKDQS